MILCEKVPDTEINTLRFIDTDGSRIMEFEIDNWKIPTVYKRVSKEFGCSVADAKQAHRNME